MNKLFAFLTLLTTSCSTPAPRLPADPIPIVPISDFQSPGSFQFLSPVITDKRIVQLGESIHMTHEQTLARSGLVRFLNQEKNFDVLAFEGSTLDFWVGMDVFLRSQRSERDVERFRKTAFFGLWQTKEIEEIARIALSSLSGPKTLYLASFDIQPGIGFGFRKQNPFLQLGKTLRFYAPQIPEKDLQRVASSLAPLQGCAQNGFPKSGHEQESALKAIAILERWIAKAGPRIAKTHASLPHREALSLVPESLKRTVELCEAHQKNSNPSDKWAIYQPKRDELNAEVAELILNKVSRHHRLITWAHHSHVNYNTLHPVRITLGEALKKKFQDGLFTIGVFAREGTALLGQEEPELKSLRSFQDGEIDTYLSELSRQSYFADLTSASARVSDLLNRPATIRIEGVGLWKARLAKDYDAILYLDRVSPPQVDFSPIREEQNQ